MAPIEYDEDEMEEFQEINADRYQGKEITEGSVEEMMQHL